jgi:hypothetical protein
MEQGDRRRDERPGFAAVILVYGEGADDKPRGKL